jgi:hypothetical protein
MNEPTKRGPGRPRKVVAEAPVAEAAEVSVEAKPKRKRRERTQFSQSRMRLHIQLIPALKDEYHIRWFNDKRDRVSRALSGGWEFILEDELEGHVGDRELHGDSSDLNGKVSKVVDNDGTVAYALKICNEFWDEDQADKLAQTDLIDEAVRAGSSGGASVANQYGDVSVTRR